MMTPCATTNMHKAALATHILPPCRLNPATLCVGNLNDSNLKVGAQSYDTEGF